MIINNELYYNIFDKRSNDIVRTEFSEERRLQDCLTASGPFGFDPLDNDYAESLERVTGIEPALKAWEALILPLNYTRKRYFCYIMISAKINKKMKGRNNIFPTDELFL